MTNTALQQPVGARRSALLRVARLSGARQLIGVRTPVLIHAALALSRPRLAKPIRDGYHAPYLTAARRAGIGVFLEDIPFGASHPSADALCRVVADVATLRDVPALLLWGASDPVSSDIFLRDLEARLPDAAVHRFSGASHLVLEDADVAGALHKWVAQLRDTPPARKAPARRPPGWAGLDRRARDNDVALTEMTAHGIGRSVSFAALDADVRRVAAGLAEHGVRRGERIALLVPPGLDLAVSVYAAWRMGAVVVLVDAGLGARGIRRALASANPRYLIGVPRALAAARLLGWPGQRISTVAVTAATARAFRVATTLAALREGGEGRSTPPTPADSDVAAVLFTSGATGPAKGVVYRHHQLQAQRDALARAFEIEGDDRFVAAFAPFALYGPAWGIPSVVPDMKVTAPGTLRAVALAEAAAAIGGSVVFASPAALANVIATAGDLTSRHREALSNVRRLLSAGAPVPMGTLRAAAELMPNAEVHTPYGMTEVLPVSDITLAGIDAAGADDGVCVGRPIAEVSVAISPLDEDGYSTAEITKQPRLTGEVCVKADHLKETYDKLWLTEQSSKEARGWYRSGDVGHLDPQGRLWVEGRMVHIIATADGPVTPVGIEQAVESLADVRHAAAVGVGPTGTQQVVMVVVPTDRPRRPGIAPVGLAERVRAAARIDVAAVLVVAALPVDKRHNSKIDRTRVSEWATGVLAGARMRAL